MCFQKFLFFCKIILITTYFLAIFLLFCFYICVVVEVGMVLEVNSKNPYKKIAGYQMEKADSNYISLEEKTSNLHDKIFNNDCFTKTKVNIEQSAELPEYMYRGFKGDPDFNFFEYLKLAKLPYFIGGIGLVSTYIAGCNHLSPVSRLGNNTTVKRVALGVAGYYLGVELAKALIDIPIKFFRGIDLNHPYKNMVSLREGNPLDLPNNKKKEYHKVFESIDFTRWDLLYKYGEAGNTNAVFDKLAKKFGATQKLNDSDSALKSRIKSLIIMASSWKAMLPAFFATLGVGLAQQKAAEDIDLRSIFKNIANLFKQDTPQRFKNLKISLNENLVKPIALGVKQIWTGKSFVSKIIGRTALLSAVGLPILANIMILNKTKIKNSEEGGSKQ